MSPTIARQLFGTGLPRQSSLRFFAVGRDRPYLFVKDMERGAVDLEFRLPGLVEHLSPISAADSVLFVDAQACLRELRTLSSSPSQLIAPLEVAGAESLLAVGFSPGLSRRLGDWHETRRLDDGLVEVTFNSHPTMDDMIVRNLEQHLLVPWILRRSHHPARAAPVSGAAQRAIALREKLEREVEFVDAKAWASWRGLGGSNPAAALGKYKDADRLFSVRSGTRELYPTFQFVPDTGLPRSAMAQVLAHVPDTARSWSLLSWFAAGNVWLDGRKPMDCIATEPDRVAQAADRFFALDA